MSVLSLALQCISLSFTVIFIELLSSSPSSASLEAFFPKFLKFHHLFSHALSYSLYCSLSHCLSLVYDFPPEKRGKAQFVINSQSRGYLIAKAHL